MGVYIFGGLMAIGLIFAIWVVISQLREKYASSVHVIWYLFSLSTCMTYVGLWWAQASGAVDVNGKAKNPVGAALINAMNFSLDLKTDFNVLSALAVLIIAPQLLSYLLSGAFGCASRPRMVSHCVNFFSWSMAKSAAIAAGVLLTVSLYGGTHSWHGFDPAFSIKYSCFALMLLVFAFVALLAKSTLDEIPILAKSRPLEPVRRWLRKVDEKMVRHRVP